jgi:hypothetical protein
MIIVPKLTETTDLFLQFQHTDTGTTCRVITAAVGTPPKVAKESGVLLGEGITTLAKEDTPNKKIGRKLALARALKASQLSREARTKVWNNYFQAVRM